jgi:hypothetical protein
MKYDNMETVTFTGRFDNGRSCYTVDASAEVDTSKNYLTDDEIMSIVSALQRADRRLHGRSYRQVIYISVSEEEFVKQQDNGNIYLKDGASEYTYNEGMEWLNTLFADRRDIESAMESEEE